MNPSVTKLLTSKLHCSFSLDSAASVSYSEKMNPKGIFANNELDLSQIKVYGFDFGEERCSSLSFIHRSEREFFRLHLGTLQIDIAFIDLRSCQDISREESPSKILSSLAGIDRNFVHCQYPDNLMNFNYRPGMGARGLHLDIKRGWLMKVDSYHNIQLGTVYQ